ncbi:MAG: hypothetical protein ACKO3N_07730, partial [Verrucomicrobiota bacterium]
GGVTVGEGRVETAGESEIGALVVESAAELRAAGRLRVTGEARLAQGLRAFGPGVVEFAGATVLTNGSQSGGVSVGHATLRNSGLWRQAIASSQGSLWGRIPEDGQPGTGAFENTGIFEQVGNWPLLIQLPFRNAVRVVLGRGPVSFDARNFGFQARAGAYRPLPGAELVLQDTSVQYSQAGTLDLAAGTVTGTGSLVALGFDPPARVINRGVLRPGHPAGVLTITAADGFEQTPSGDLVARIGPAGASLLRVDRGVTRLGGRLRVELLDGFVPAAGQSHLVLSAAELEGQFESTVLPDPGPGLAWEVVQEAAGVVVRVLAR